MTQQVAQHESNAAITQAEEVSAAKRDSPIAFEDAVDKQKDGGRFRAAGKLVANLIASKPINFEDAVGGGDDDEDVEVEDEQIKEQAADEAEGLEEEDEDEDDELAGFER